VRGAARLLAEVKGRTSEPGIDADIAYGQLLRRMPAEDDPGAQFALVVPDWSRSVRAAARVPARVRELLRVTLCHDDDCGNAADRPTDHGPHSVADHDRGDDPGEGHGQPRRDGGRVAKQAPHAGDHRRWR
jgi:hypothetical protein